MSMRLQELPARFRAFLCYVASKSSRAPIETIVFCLIIASFSYASLFRTFVESDCFNDKTPTLESTQVIARADSDNFIPLATRESITQASRLQLKQIIIEGTSGDYYNVLDKKILESVLELQHVLEKVMDVNDGMNKLYYNDDLCYKSTLDNTGSCFVASPLQIWNNNYGTLHSDTNILETVRTRLELNEAQHLFRDLNLQENTNNPTALALTYAFNTNGPFRVRWANMWEDKVATLKIGRLASIGKKQQQEIEKGSVAWLLMSLGNMASKIREAIRVRKRQYDRIIYLP